MTRIQTKSLSLTEVLQRALAYTSTDVEPLLNYLKMDASDLELNARHKTQKNAEKIADYLCKMGSNDLATIFRGGKGVGYSEVVCDVGEKLGAPGIDSSKSIESNEKAILEKLFADALDSMSESEKRDLFSSMGITRFELPYTSAGVLIIQQLAVHYGGFAVYKISIILANIIARALLGRGLTLAANVLISRSIGVALGPVGWIVTGAWLAIDLAGPAFRKTVPAVVHVAMLRQLVCNRITIGVVGDASVGKDALFKSAFGLDTGNIDAVAGSTSETKAYQLGNTGAINLVNFPGFNDVRPEVESLTNDHLNHTDVFLLVVDLNRGVSGTDKNILNLLERFKRPILVCLNKVDQVRPNDKAKLVAIAQERLGGLPMIETAFDPDPRLHDGGAIGGADVFEWVKKHLIEAGKEVLHLKREF